LNIKLVAKGCSSFPSQGGGTVKELVVAILELHHASYLCEVWGAHESITASSPVNRDINRAQSMTVRKGRQEGVGVKEGMLVTMGQALVTTVFLLLSLMVRTIFLLSSSHSDMVLATWLSFFMLCDTLIVKCC